MPLKTATLIALCGIGLSFILGLVQAVSYPAPAMVILHSLLFNGPLLLFLFTLYRNQK